MSPIDELLDIARRRKLTPAQLARAADLPYATAHKLLSGKMRAIPWETADKFAAALGFRFILGARS